MLFVRTLCLMVWLLPGLLLSAQAQSFQWVQAQPISYSVNPSLLSYGLDADAQGNAVVAGWKDQLYLYGTAFGRLAVTKYSPTGTLLFSGTIGGRARLQQLRTDASQNILVLGEFKDSVRFSPTLRFLKTPSILSTEFFLAKYDAAGNLLWAKQMGTTLGTDVDDVASMVLDPAGNVYLGYSRNFSNTEVARLRADGTGQPQVLLVQQQVRTISGLSLDARGNLYVTGACASANPVPRFGGQLFPTTFAYNTYVARYSAAGAVRWVRFVEDITCPRISIAPDRQYGVIVASHALAGQQFGPYTALGPQWTADFFVARLDSSGTWRWMREMPRTAGMFGDASPGSLDFLTTDAAGNSYFCGSTRGTVTWSGSTTTTSTGGMPLLLSYDPAGNLRWVRTSDPATTLAAAHSVTAGPGGNVYLAGFGRGAIVFGSAQANTGAEAIFLTKLNTSTLAAYPTALRGSWTLAPNPATDHVRVQFGNPSVLPEYLEVLDALGRVVQRAAVSGPTLELNTADLAAGLYVVRAEAAGQRWQARLVK